MTKHSPEPWRIGADAGFQLIQILSAEGFQTCVGEQSCGIDDARRIVACVNACRGIPTEMLERSVLEQICLNRWMINALPHMDKDPA